MLNPGRVWNTGIATNITTVTNKQKIDRQTHMRDNRFLVEISFINLADSFGSLVISGKLS